MLRLVLRSAKRLSDEPACSNAAQNRAEDTNSTRMAAHRLRSIRDQLPKKISQENTTTEIPSKHQPSPSEITVGVSWITPVAPSNARIASTATPAPTPKAASRFCFRSSAALPDVA